MPIAASSASGRSPEERLKEEDGVLSGAAAAMTAEHSPLDQATGYNRLMRSKITLLLLAIAALLPAIASPAVPGYAETCVWGFEAEMPAGARAERGSSPTGIEGYLACIRRTGRGLSPSYVGNNPINRVDPNGSTAAEVANYVNEVLVDFREFAADDFSDGSLIGVALTTASGSGFDLVMGVVDLITVGDATGTALGSGASGADLALAVGGDSLRVLALAAPLVAGARGAAARTTQKAVSGGGAAAKVAPRACFAPGTAVWTEEGLLAVEQVEPGQLVSCADVETDEWSFCEVEERLEHDYAGLIVALVVDGEVIRATGNHPFWVDDGEELGLRPLAVDAGIDAWSIEGQGRWVEAKDLDVGDILLLVDGRRVSVSAVSDMTVSMQVFNLRVAGLQTYAVGKSGLLVHNKAMPRKPGKLGQFKGTDALRRENKVMRDVANEFKLNKAQQRQLHDEISGEGLGFHEIRATAKAMFGGS